jgi:hypothetical protein
MRRALILTAVGVVLWAVLIGPALSWFGEIALLHSTVALALSLVPGVATMLLADAAWRRSPDLQVLAALGGSGVRMALALGIGLVLFFGYRQTFGAVFLAWLMIFYLVLLGVEVMLLLQPAQTQGTQALQDSQAFGKETKASC